MHMGNKCQSPPLCERGFRLRSLQCIEPRSTPFDGVPVSPVADYYFVPWWFTFQLLTYSKAHKSNTVLTTRIVLTTLYSLMHWKYMNFQLFFHFDAAVSQVTETVESTCLCCVNIAIGCFCILTFFIQNLSWKSLLIVCNSEKSLNECTCK